MKARRCLMELGRRSFLASALILTILFDLLYSFYTILSTIYHNHIFTTFFIPISYNP